MQVFYISKKYFSYPFSTIITTISEPTDDQVNSGKVPDLTFCLILPPFEAETAIDCSGNSTSVSSARYLFRYFYDFEENLDTFIIKNGFNTSIHSSVLGDSICFTAKLETVVSKDRNENRYENEDEKLLMSVSFNLSNIADKLEICSFVPQLFQTSFHLTLPEHGFKRLLSPGLPYPLNSEHLDYDMGVSRKITFEEITVVLLPPPFADNCFDYKSLQSQDNCFYECIKKAFLKLNASSYNYPVESNSELSRFSSKQDRRKLRYGPKCDFLKSHENDTTNCEYFPRQILHQLSQEGIQIQSLTIKEFKELGKKFAVQGKWDPKYFERVCKDENEYCVYTWPFTSEMESVDKQCQENCSRKDCRIMRIVGYDLQSFHVKNMVIVNVTSPRKLAVIMKSKPYFNMVEYILYVLGCLEFWMSVSPLALVLDLENIVQKISSRKKQSNNLEYYQTVAQYKLIEINDWINDFYGANDMKKPSKYMLWFNQKKHRVLPLVVAFLGCILQTTYICQEYFTYPVVVHSTITFPENISIPGLTVCVAPEDFHPVFNINLSITPFDGRTPDEILSEFPKQMIRYMFQPTHHLSGEKDFQLHRFLSHGKYCYDASIRDVNKTLPKGTSLTSVPRGYGLGFLYKISYDMRYSSINRSKGLLINFHQSQHLDVNSPEILIYPWAERHRSRNYHSRYFSNKTLAKIDQYPMLASDLPEVGHWAVQNLIRKGFHTKEDIEFDLINNRARQFIRNMTENELVDFSLKLSGRGPMSSSFGNTDFICMTFRKLSWIRMPAPYQTNCFEYQDILQVSDATQYDCFDICMKTRVSDVIGYLPIDSTLSRFKTNMSIPIFDPDKRNSSKELYLYRKIKENCFRRCSARCLQEDCNSSSARQICWCT